MKWLALLSAAQVDGHINEIIAGSEVDDPEDGQLWWSENAPDDGTEVDYILIDWGLYKAAPKLLSACDEFVDGWIHFCKCIDFGRSNLDAKAIRFMNEVPGKLEQAAIAAIAATEE